MQCGHQPGNSNGPVFCTCPTIMISAYPDGKYNGGVFLGRRCWRIAGTLCEGEVQGIFAQKIDSCRKCSFFQKVQEEEGENFAF